MWGVLGGVKFRLGVVVGGLGDDFLSLDSLHVETGVRDCVLCAFDLGGVQGYSKLFWCQWETCTTVLDLRTEGSCGR